MNDQVNIDAFAAVPVDRSWFGRQKSCAKPVDIAQPKPNRIALLAHCGTGNLGDEASIAAVLDNITRRSPGVSVMGLSMDPVDTTRRLGIPCFAMRQRIFPFQREWSSAPRFPDRAGFAGRLKVIVKKTGPLFRIAKVLRQALIVRPVQVVREVGFLARALLLVCELDMLIICGGGQLLDWGGPWAFPYTLFKWIVLAKCAHVKCVFLNSGAGPLDSSLSRWFVKRMLNMADYVSLRDAASGELLRRIGFRGKMKVVADAVWGFHVPDRLVSEPTEQRTELVVGVAPMAYGDSSRHWISDDRAYRHLIASMAEFCCWMLTRGYRIKLFSSDIWFDSQAILDLDAAIRHNCPLLASDRVMREAITNTSDMFAALSGLDFYVTCRFHGVVFASLLGVPTLALAPHPKVTTLMNDLGLSDYCVDISRCDADDLKFRADQLIANMDEIKARICMNAAKFQSQLNLQFDALFLPDADTHSGRATYSREGT
ncbi:MAG TPA: polysaccharide pyruvyl transferase family protein [Beijerinckiaceae bacterium]|jgi:polysaccharide pyruvyl transferase WcaK-like protein|nr:polysaccharide pyruvyl transferase family protein [Beijerinckiaceae bacterium]